MKIDLVFVCFANQKWVKKGEAKRVAYFKCSSSVPSNYLSRIYVIKYLINYVMFEKKSSLCDWCSIRKLSHLTQARSLYYVIIHNALCVCVCGILHLMTNVFMHELYPEKNSIDISCPINNLYLPKWNVT